MLPASIIRGGGTANFDFSFPSEIISGKKPDHWTFENILTQEKSDVDGRDLFNYELEGENTLYRVSILDEFDSELCYLLVQLGACDEFNTEARAFSVEKGICTGDVPASSCTYMLDASNSPGGDLIYHWFLDYENPDLDQQITSFRPDTSIGVAFPDSLLSICLVTTSSCGMASYCWKGNCSYTVDAYMEIEEVSENQIVLDLINRFVPCTSSVSIITIDWGDGTAQDYELFGAWDELETYPRHTYSESGTYSITVRLPYRCDVLSGDFETRSCVVCLSQQISVGGLEDDEDCERLTISPGPLREFWQVFYLDVETPFNYEFKGYKVTRQGDEFADAPLITRDSVELAYGFSYRVYVVFESTGGSNDTFLCSKPIFVEYPTEEIILFGDDVCAGTGSTQIMPIRVTNFNEVTGFQFRMDLVDGAIAKILSVDNLNEELGISKVDIQLDTTQNRLQFAWTASDAGEAKTVPDQSILFTLRIQAVGPTTDTAQTEFSNAFAFNNIKDIQIPVTTVPAFFCIEANFAISGRIYSEDEFALPMASVFLNGPTPMTDTTKNDGTYSFENLGSGDFEIGAFLEDDFRRGVNVIDLAILKAYNRSFGEMGLSTPYKLLAANLRKQLDGKQISVADETALKRLISSDIDELDEYQTPWILVPTDHEFGDPEKANLEDYASERHYEPLNQTWQDQDFIAIKIGDLDGSTFQGITKKRSAEIIHLSMDTLEVSSSDDVTIQIKADELINIQNLQFSIKWDPNVLQYTGFDRALSGLELDESSFSTRFIEEGVLTFVHSIAPGSISATDSSLFALNFIAIGPTGTNTSIEIIGDPVEILITDDAFVSQTVVSHPGQVNIEMTSSTSAADHTNFEVGLAWPNPFDQTLHIPIQTESIFAIQLKIYNLLGQKILQRERTLHPGEHVIRILAEELENAGQYFFVLEGPQINISRPFILIK